MIMDKPKWAKVLIQLRAATAPSEFEATVTRLTRLKLQKPTQTMDAASVSVFLEDIADMLTQDGYGYPAIDQGITELIRKEKERFFPTYERLRHYIYPTQYKFKRRADKLEEMLQRKEIA